MRVLPDFPLSMLKFPMTNMPYLALDRQTQILFFMAVNPRLPLLLFLTNESMMIVFSSPATQVENIMMDTMGHWKGEGIEGERGGERRREEKRGEERGKDREREREEGERERGKEREGGREREVKRERERRRERE